jgi:stress response protein YsnF
MKKKTNEEKEKKYELTELTRHTLNSYRESLIIKKEKTN